MIKQILHLDFPRIEKRKFQESLKIVAIGLGVFMVFVVLRNIAISFDLFERTSHPNSSRIKEGDCIQLIKVFISTVLLTPLFEELSFRLSLSLKRTSVLLGFSFMISYILLIFDVHHLLPLERFRPPIFFFTIGLAIYLVTRFIVPNFELCKERLWIVILFSSMAFALIHLNVNTAQTNLLAYFLLLAPYFISGYLLAYARLTMGLGYAILCHSMTNGFYFLINVLLRP